VIALSSARSDGKVEHARARDSKHATQQSQRTPPEYGLDDTEDFLLSNATTGAGRTARQNLEGAVSVTSSGAARYGFVVVCKLGVW